MSAEIRIVGNNVEYDGQIVAVILEGLVPSTRFGFCDAIESMASEESIAELINEAEAAAHNTGALDNLEDVRSAVEEIDFDGDDAEKTLNDKLDRLEAALTK